MAVAVPLETAQQFLNLLPCYEDECCPQQTGNRINMLEYKETSNSNGSGVGNSAASGDSNCNSKQNLWQQSNQWQDSN